MRLLIFLALIVSYISCWLIVRNKEKRFHYYMNASFGVCLTTFYLSRFFIERSRAIVYFENLAIVLLLITILLLVLVIFIRFFRLYKPEAWEMVLKIRNDYYNETFRVMHRYMTLYSTKYLALCKFLFRTCPVEAGGIGICIGLFIVLPYIIINILLIIEGVQGYLDYTIRP